MIIFFVDAFISDHLYHLSQSFDYYICDIIYNYEKYKNNSIKKYHLSFFILFEAFFLY